MQQFYDAWAQVSAQFNEIDRKLNAWKSGAETGSEAAAADLLACFARDVQTTLDFQEPAAPAESGDPPAEEASSEASGDDAAAESSEG